MCGIFGIITKDKDIAGDLIDGLKSLEYRGYDSAGIAVMKDNEIEILKSTGKISKLKAAYDEMPVDGIAGIAHTRWATHGAVSLVNTHPIKVEDIAIVHNGIVDNFLELKDEIISKYNYQTKTQTDTEIIAALIHHSLIENDGDMMKVMGIMKKKLIGKMSFVIICERFPDMIICMNLGRQLILGIGNNNANYIASDAIAFPDNVNDIIYLHDGDIGIIKHNSYEIYNSGEKIIRNSEKHSFVKHEMGMKSHSTFMHKEIYEQQEILEKILIQCIESSGENNIMNAIKSVPWNKYEKIHIIACGAAFYAGYLGKYLIEKQCNILTNIDVASEFSQRDPVIDTKTIYIFISQSGETADTIAALEKVKQKDGFIVSIVNRLQSHIARISDVVIPTHAGIEQSVAATKSFTAQILIMQIIATHISNKENAAKIFSEMLGCLNKLPINTDFEKKITDVVSHTFLNANRVIYIARNFLYPICLEGALKIKEIGYIAADAIPAGEIKHGPLALVDEKTPIVALAPYDNSATFSKILSSIQEIKARNGCIIVITCSKGAEIISKIVDDERKIIIMPETHSLMLPIHYTIPLQFIAYHYALLVGNDIDKPRNLAKSVTVE